MKQIVIDILDHEEAISRAILLTAAEIKRLCAIPVIEESIDVKQAAAFVGLEEQTIYNHVGKGTIPFYKKGGRLYFYKSELTNWIKSGTRHGVREKRMKIALKQLEK